MLRRGGRAAISDIVSDEFVPDRLQQDQAVIYRGPFKQVQDDDGHSYWRGERMAVCDKTFQLLQQAPYDESFEAIAPLVNIALDDAMSMDCRRNARRNARESKGLDYSATSRCDTDGSYC